MVPCEFSETQFSFCFTFEYIRQFWPLVPLPIFPNTVAEGRPGGGYDVQILGNMYFQFKIPRYYDQVSNFWRRDWDVFGHEYYKIKTDTDSEQFRLLITLETVPGNKAFYSTPEFHLGPDLASNYDGDLIVDRSAVFPIEYFPVHGSGNHELVYDSTADYGVLFSEPVQISKADSLDPKLLFESSPRDQTIRSQAQLLYRLLTSGDFFTRRGIEFRPDEPDKLVMQVYTLLLAVFDIHWYPIVLGFI